MMLVASVRLDCAVQAGKSTWTSFGRGGGGGATVPAAFFAGTAAGAAGVGDRFRLAAVMAQSKRRGSRAGLRTEGQKTLTWNTGADLRKSAPVLEVIT